MYGRDPNSYFSGGAGDRTLNALKHIVNVARTSKETKPSSTLKINASNSVVSRIYLERLVRQDETGIWTVVGYDPVNKEE